MKQIYEIKAFYERTSYEKVWVEVVAESKEEAVHLIRQGEGDWMDSKELDGDGDWKDYRDWIVTGTRPLPGHDLGDDSEEYD